MVIDKKKPQYDRLMRLANKVSRGRAFTVGVHAEDSGSSGENYPPGATVADIAEANEFGIGVPERSFIRGWFDERKQWAEKQIYNAMLRSVNTGLDPDITLRQVAELFGADVQVRITRGIPPPNAPATKTAKNNKSKPLIDTGALKASIRGTLKR